MHAQQPTPDFRIWLDPAVPSRSQSRPEYPHHRFRLEERYRKTEDWDFALRFRYRLAFSIALNRYTVEPGAFYVPLKAELFVPLGDDIEELTLRYGAEKAWERRRSLPNGTLQVMLGGPHDGAGAFVAISAGAGGIDSCDWAEILLRMYGRWADVHGYDIEAIERIDEPDKIAGARRRGAPGKPLDERARFMA